MRHPLKIIKTSISRRFFSATPNDFGLRSPDLVKWGSKYKATGAWLGDEGCKATKPWKTHKKNGEIIGTSLENEG